jgi:membrane protein implicated in regulation of membrane protease activity
MRTFVKHNSLSLFFGAIFLASLVGQAIAGTAEYNNEQITNGFAPVSLLSYVTTSDFAVDVTENWQSEYLQFLLYIFAAVWFLQRGSPESKELDKAGTESDKEQKVGRYADADSPLLARYGDLRTTLYSRSLGIVMGAIFLASWFGQSVAGKSAFNEEQLQQLQDPVSWFGYITSASFWSRTLQNWQSEFLAVGSMAVLSVYLRQRGSPESKPVGEAHDATGVTG